MPQTEVIPVARPAPPSATQLQSVPDTTQPVIPTAMPVAHASDGMVALPPNSSMVPLGPERDLLVVKTRRAESMAVASAVIGVTGFIPIISQVASIWLGMLAILRIRKARQNGLDARFKGWAVLGLISSVIGLLGWIGMAVGAMFLQSTLGNSTDMMQGILTGLP